MPADVYRPGYGDAEAPFTVEAAVWNCAVSCGE